MSSKRTHFMLIGLLLLLCIGLVGGGYAAGRALQAQANVLLAAKAKKQALELQQQNLAKVKKEISKYTELKKIADAVVPEDKNQAEAIRQIVAIAEKNDITLSSITFPASTLGNSTAKATGTTTAPAANSSTARLSQLTPVKGIPGVYELPITIQNDSLHPVRYDSFINFLAALERNRRTAQVSNITIQPTATNRNYLIFNLSITEYIKP